MNLSALILAAILRVIPSMPTDTARSYADDIAAAVDGADQPVELAMSMVATAYTETQMAPRLARCACKPFECDGRDARTGAFRALSIYQLHKQWRGSWRDAEVCADNRLASKLAAKALVTLRKRHGTIRKAMRWYVGCSATDRRVTARLKTYETLIANAMRAQRGDG